MLFAIGGGFSEEDHGRLVREGEHGQVTSVGASGFIDESELLANGTGAEQEDHDKGVGEANFGTVDGAIAHGFEESKVVGIFGIEDDAIYGILKGVRPIVGN